MRQLITIHSNRNAGYLLRCNSGWRTATGKAKQQKHKLKSSASFADHRSQTSLEKNPLKVTKMLELRVEQLASFMLLQTTIFKKNEPSWFAAINTKGWEFQVTILFKFSKFWELVPENVAQWLQLPVAYEIFVLLVNNFRFRKTQNQKDYEHSFTEKQDPGQAWPGVGEAYRYAFGFFGNFIATSLLRLP